MLQPEQLRGSGCNTLSHSGLETLLYVNEWFILLLKNWSGASCFSLYKNKMGKSNSLPGFLERELICLKARGIRYADFLSFFLNIP